MERTRGLDPLSPAFPARDLPSTQAERICTYLGKNKNGTRFEIHYTGPDLPGAIPERLISPTEIPKDPNWRGEYRLVVSPPNIALDLCWTPGEPLRIMTFSRGDWEAELMAQAGG